MHGDLPAARYAMNPAGVGCATSMASASPARMGITEYDAARSVHQTVWIGHVRGTESVVPRVVHLVGMDDSVNGSVNVRLVSVNVGMGHVEKQVRL